MSKKYKITIRDKHYADGEKSESEMSVFGSLTFSKDDYKISYMEHDGDLAGCVTTISVSSKPDSKPDSIYMSREGSFTTNLLLEPKRRTTCHYDTPFGSMMLGVYTYKIDSDMGQSGGNLDFAYCLDVEGSTVSESKLHIGVSEVN